MALLAQNLDTEIIALTLTGGGTIRLPTGPNSMPPGPAIDVSSEWRRLDEDSISVANARIESRTLRLVWDSIPDFPTPEGFIAPEVLATDADVTRIVQELPVSGVPSQEWIDVTRVLARRVGGGVNIVQNFNVDRSGFQPIDLSVDLIPSIPLGNRQFQDGRPFSDIEHLFWKCPIPEDVQAGRIFEVIWEWYATNSDQASVQASVSLLDPGELTIFAATPGVAGNNLRVSLAETQTRPAAPDPASVIIVPGPPGTTTFEVEIISNTTSNLEVLNVIGNPASASFGILTRDRIGFPLVLPPFVMIGAPVQPQQLQGGVDELLWQNFPLVVECRAFEHLRRDIRKPNAHTLESVTEVWFDEENPPELAEGEVAKPWQQNLELLGGGPNLVVRKTRCNVTVVDGNNSVLQLEFRRRFIPAPNGQTLDQFAGDVRVMGISIRLLPES